MDPGRVDWAAVALAVSAAIGVLLVVAAVLSR